MEGSRKTGPEAMARRHLLDRIRRKEAIDRSTLALRGARLVGEDLSGLDLSGIDVSGADLSFANLSGAKLRGSVLFGAQLDHAELLGVDLRDAKLDGASAQRAGFGGSDLRNARLHGAKLSGAAFDHARLCGAELHCADLQGARLLQADLSDADFTCADLRSANLSACTVRGACFERCDLRGAQLSEVSDFERADWLGVDIRDTNFRGAFRLRRFIIDENYLHEFRAPNLSSRLPASGVPGGEWDVRATDFALLALARREGLLTLETFAARVAHEINNPMSYVLSNLRRAQEYVRGLPQLVPEAARKTGEMREVERVIEELGSILAETEEGLGRVRQMAARLNAFVPRKDGPKREVDLNEVVETALSMARLEAHPSVLFEKRLEPLPPVQCARAALVHAVFNLVANAVDAVGESGTIRVSTFHSGQRALIEVRDDGPGIRPGDREFVFEPFYTTKLDGSPGLGLGIAREIATAQSGDLRVVDDGGGFVLSLPLASARPASRRRHHGRTS